MRADPIYTSFNGGEVSPLLGGRPDLEKWNAALQVCQNLIPRVQGALTRRGGTRYVAPIKTAANKSWLMAFTYSRNDAFVLEFGDGYVRFFRNRGVLTTGAVAAWNSVTGYAIGDLVLQGGVRYYAKATSINQSPPNATYWHPLTADIYEIPSPYALADLTAADGSFALKFEQSGDILYITHSAKTYAPRTLTRSGNVRWIFALFTPEGGPFKDGNQNQALQVHASGTLTVGATATVTSNVPGVFGPSNVGALFYLEVQDGTNEKPWEVYQKAVVGNVRISDGKYYVCTQIGPPVGSQTNVTGQEKPVHTSGKYWDGDGEDLLQDNYGSIGAEWLYQHPGYGWLKITGYTSTLEMTGQVLSLLPDQVAGSNVTWRWAHGAWSDVDGWPNNVCFYRERLTFFRDTKVWASVAGDFANFKAKEFGETLPDSAVSIDVQSQQGNPILWVKPLKGRLFVGTAAGVHSIDQQTNQQVFGPGNTKQNPETAVGGTSVAALQIGSDAVFVGKGGRKLRRLTVSQAGDGFDAVDLNKYRGGLASSITWIAWAQNPHEVIWAGCANGDLKGLTFMQEDGVFGWHSHPIGGAGIVEAGCVIPSPDGTRDDLWLIVRRTINGATARYVEYIGEELDFDISEDQSLVVYGDSGLTYSGAATTTLTGLGHLEGQVVNVKVNGAAHPQRTVSGGSIDLNIEATTATVSLPAPYRGKLMPIEAGGNAGTAQGKIKRIHRLKARLVATLGGAFGPDFDNLDAVQYRNAYDLMDQPPALLTGDTEEIAFPGDYDGQATIAFGGGDADDFPFNLIALMPELSTS